MNDNSTAQDAPTAQHSAIVAMLVQHLLPTLPPLASLQETPLGQPQPDDMGPQVTLPAVYVHILLSHMQLQDHQLRIAQIERTKPLKPIVDLDVWPDTALHLLREASDDGNRALAATHVAVPRSALAAGLAYIDAIEAELRRTPSPLSDIQRAVVIRSAARAIVDNVEGFTGELDGPTRDGYVRQAMREISIVTRRLAGGCVPQ